MEEAMTYAAAAPFIVLVVAVIRAIAPEVRGRAVPLLVLVLTTAWGGLLTASERFTGDPPEFVLATVVVTAAAMGISGAVSTLAKKDSAFERNT